MANIKTEIPASGKLLLQVKTNDAESSLEVDLSGTEGYILGRSDAKSTYLPDIDLAVFDGLDKGVSRRHAALVRFLDKIHVVDLNSINGTFLNGERLSSEIPYPLNVGDKLLLGSLQLVINHVG